MNDLISRKAAMVVIGCSGLDDDSKDTVVRVLEQLPSAQSEIIRCNSCRHDNNCAIQDIAQVGGKFFCGFAQQKGEQP